MKTKIEIMEEFENSVKEKPQKMPKEYLHKDRDHKRGKHCWVAHCDKNGNELWGYCECCGVINNEN